MFFASFVAIRQNDDIRAFKEWNKLIAEFLRTPGISRRDGLKRDQTVASLFALTNENG
jgi:hypothetical protein